MRPVAADIQINPARDGDAAAIAALLRNAHLPADDFVPHLPHFLVARRGNEIVGAVGAEVVGREALLRSLVVAPGERGAGLGGRLVAEIERAAEDWGVRSWWLLTTTAERFFLARGFAVRRRNDAPPAIAATKEFRELCPSVAVCLSRQRNGGG